MTRSARRILFSACLLFGAVGCTDDAAVPASNAPAEAASNYGEFDRLFADWAPRYVECARSHGADARLTEDGGVQNAYAPGRPTTQGLDAQCVQEVGLPPEVPALNDQFLAGLFELYVVQAQCLREQGYMIAEPPSQKVWVEGYDGESWNPLMEVHRAGRDVAEADRLCPQPDPREAERSGSGP